MGGSILARKPKPEPKQDDSPSYFMEGVEARDRGRKRNHNPYKPFSWEAEAWRDGWDWRHEHGESE